MPMDGRLVAAQVVAFRGDRCARVLIVGLITGQAALDRVEI